MSVIRLFICVLFSLLGLQATAETALFDANPNSVVLMSISDVERITTVYSPTTDANSRATIQGMFTRQGLPPPSVQRLETLTMEISLNVAGTAVIVTSADSANEILDPLYDIAGMRFWFVEQTTIPIPATITYGGVPIIGQGQEIATEDGSRPIMIVNGAIQQTYRTLLVPNALPRSQIDDLLGRMSISVDEIRAFVDSDINGLRAPDIALLTDSSGFQNAAFRGLPALFNNPQIYLVEDTFTFNDVSDLVNRATPPETGSPLIGAIDRSKALSQADFPAPDSPEPSSQRAPREFDFGSLPPNTCHAILPSDGTQDRIALVIGNGAYLPHIGWLENPLNDAQSIARVLYAAGFGIYFLTEATRTVVQDCLTQLTSTHIGVDVALMYYAGHGLQVEDSNYLLGIDAGQTDDLQENLISVDDAMTTLRAISQSSLIFLDACRNNPLAPQDQTGLAAVSGGNVAANAGTQQSDFAIVYAAAPNQLALDGNGDNSPFTAALTQALATPGIPVQEAIVRVSADVQRATNYQQQPFIRSNLTRLIYLNAEESLQDLIDKSVQASANAMDRMAARDRNDALASILRHLPSNASDAELSGDFTVAYETARSLYFAQVDTLNGLSGPLYSASKIGQTDRYFTISLDGTVELRGVESSSSLFQARLSDPASAYQSSPAISRDGSILAFATNAQQAYVLDAHTGAQLYRFDDLQLPEDIRSYSGLEGVQLSPDGRTMLVKYYGWTIVIDVTTGAQITAFDVIDAGVDANYSLGAIDLQNDHLCFVLRPGSDHRGASALIGTLSLRTLDVETIKTDQDVGYIENAKCSADGRYLAYLSYADSDGSYAYNVVDLMSGSALVHFPAGTLSGSGAMGYFLPTENEIVLTTGNGLALFDLEAAAFTYTEPFREWHSMIGAYGLLNTPPHGHVGQATKWTTVDRLTAVSAPPTLFIEIALASLPDAVAADVISNRPILANP